MTTLRTHRGFSSAYVKRLREQNMELYPGQDKTWNVLKDVMRERITQELRWGRQEHGLADYYTILAEEFGEVGKALCEFNLQKVGSLSDIREELIQTAAVAVAMVERLDRLPLSPRNGGKGD